MSAFLVAALRIAFLALIWAFVLLAAGVIRSDIFGQRVDTEGRRVRGRRARADYPDPTPQPAQRKALPQASRLLVTEGRQAGQVFELRGVTGLGRAASQGVTIDDDYSSSRHAQLVPGGDGTWIIEDLNSTNGTYVNGTQVSQPTRLGPGDVVRIGRTQLRLEA